MTDAANEPNGKREPTTEEKITLMAVTIVCLGTALSKRNVSLESVLQDYKDESLRAIISVGIRIASKEARTVMAGSGEPS